VGGAPKRLAVCKADSSPFVDDCLRKAKADWLLAEPDDLSNDPVLLPTDDDLTKGSNMSSCSPRSISPPPSSVFKSWSDAEGA